MFASSSLRRDGELEKVWEFGARGVWYLHSTYGFRSRLRGVRTCSPTLSFVVQCDKGGAMNGYILCAAVCQPPSHRHHSRYCILRAIIGAAYPPSPQKLIRLDSTWAKQRCCLSDKTRSLKASPAAERNILGAANL